jgi:hypothetical protein
MSNQFYDSARHDIPAGSMPWETGTFRSTLVNASYVFDPAHAAWSDISAFILAGVTDQNLAGKALSPVGAGSANSLSFSDVTAGQVAAGVITYQDVGGGLTRLMTFHDTGVNFPLSTTGATVSVDWSNTPVNGVVFIVN